MLMQAGARGKENSSFANQKDTHCGTTVQRVGGAYREKSRLFLWLLSTVRPCPLVIKYRKTSSPKKRHGAGSGWMFLLKIRLTQALILKNNNNNNNSLENHWLLLGLSIQLPVCLFCVCGRALLPHLFSLIGASSRCLCSPHTFLLSLVCARTLMNETENLPEAQLCPLHRAQGGTRWGSPLSSCWLAAWCSQ